MKNSVIRILHSIFGYERYLRIFTSFKIRTLSWDKRKSDFLFFVKTIPADANVIVAGACTGITTIPVAAGFPTRKVFAYEPIRDNYNALTASVGKRGLSNVAAFRVGLGNEKSERKFILPLVDGVRKQGLAHIVDATITDYNNGIEEAVDMDALDNRAELKGIKIGAIKLVAENFELPILRGASTLITLNRPFIYCELQENEQRKQVLQYMRGMKYTVCYRQNDRLVPLEGMQYTGRNLFFVPFELNARFNLPVQSKV